jgi:hypothetical protein
MMNAVRLVDFGPPSGGWRCSAVSGHLLDADNIEINFCWCLVYFLGRHDGG